VVIVASIPSEYKPWIPCQQKAIDCLPGKDAHAMIFLLDRRAKTLVGCESGNEYFRLEMKKYSERKKFGIDILSVVQEHFEKYFNISIQAKIIQGPKLGTVTKLDADCAPIAMFIAEYLVAGREFKSPFDFNSRIKYRKKVFDIMKDSASPILYKEMSESGSEGVSDSDSDY